MALDKQNLVFGHLYNVNGSAIDISGNGNDGTLINTGGFFKGERGWYYKPAAGGSIRVAASSSLQLTKGTFVFYVKPKTILTTARFFWHVGSGTEDLWIYGSNTSSMLIYNGTASSTMSADWSNAKTVTITLDSGGVKPKMYIDGVYAAEGSNNIELVPVATNLVIYDGSADRQCGLYGMLVYNEAKTPAEVAAIHNEVIKLKTPNVGTRPKDSLGSADPNDVGVVSAWNLSKGANGKVMDVGSNNHGTISGSVTQVRTPWGEPAMDFDGTSGYLNCGSSADLNFTTQSFGGYMWLNYNSIGVDSYLVNKGSLNVRGYYLFFANSGAKHRFTINQSGAYQQVVGSTSPVVGKWILVGFLSEAGGNNYVYHNATNDSASVVARTNPLTSPDNLYLCRSNSASGYANVKMTKPAIGTFANKAEYDAWMKKEYNRVANKVMYRQDFESAPVMYSAIGSGTLPGTDVEVVSGTHKISYDTTLRKNVLECVTTGACVIPNPQGNAAYGAIEFKARKATTAGTAGAGFSNLKTGAITNGYLYYLSQGGSKTGLWNGASDIFAGSATVANTWYDLKITRTTENSFSMYLNGTLDPATVGTNPKTDATYTTAKYLILYLTAGDKISYVKKTFGVAI